MEIYDESGLTPYEIEKQNNIISNYQFMKACGLPVEPLIYVKESTKVDDLDDGNSASNISDSSQEDQELKNSKTKHLELKFRDVKGLPVEPLITTDAKENAKVNDFYDGNNNNGNSSNISYSSQDDCDFKISTVEHKNSECSVIPGVPVEPLIYIRKNNKVDDLYDGKRTPNISCSSRKVGKKWKVSKKKQKSNCRYVKGLPIDQLIYIQNNYKVDELYDGNSDNKQVKIQKNSDSSYKVEERKILKEKHIESNCRVVKDLPVEQLIAIDVNEKAKLDDHDDSSSASNISDSSQEDEDWRISKAKHKKSNCSVSSGLKIKMFKNVQPLFTMNVKENVKVDDLHDSNSTTFDSSEGDEDWKISKTKRKKSYRRVLKGISKKVKFSKKFSKIKNHSVELMKKTEKVSEIKKQPVEPMKKTVILVEPMKKTEKVSEIKNQSIEPMKNTDQPVEPMKKTEKVSEIKNQSIEPMKNTVQPLEPLKKSEKKSSTSFKRKYRSLYDPEVFLRKKKAIKTNNCFRNKRYPKRAKICEMAKEVNLSFPDHGSLLPLAEKTVNDDEFQRLIATLPPGIEIKDSLIPNAGLGVFATEKFDVGVRFGPYQGKKICPDIIKKDLDTSYMWEIMEDGNVLYYVDGKDERLSNWMRYMNFSCNVAEQNVVAFQYDREIYFRIHKQVDKGKELLFWYEDDYANMLEIINSKKASLQCKNCGVCFTSENDFILHNGSCETENENLNVKIFNHEVVNKLIDKDNSDDTVKKLLKSSTSEYETGVNSCLTNKLKVGTSKNPFKCISCDYRTTHKGNFLRHLRTHFDEKSFKCTYCNYTCKYKIGVIAHEKKHTGEKPIKSSNYDYEPTLKSNLKTHEKTHTSEKPFKCSYCDYSCKYKIGVIAHEKTHIGKKLFKCNNCDYKSTLKSNLTTHAKIHISEKSFKCSYCEYKTRTKAHLKKHLNTHKRFKCIYCDYKCALKTNLMRHVRTHSNEKPFKCTYCNYETKNRGHISRHVLIHTGEKPYKCTYCDFKCALKFNLMTHQKTHTGEKPFKCAYCDYKSIQKIHLTAHEKTHTG